MLRSVTALALAALALTPSVAAAAGWSRPASFNARTSSFSEPAPRAAVAEDGTSVAAWIQGRDVRLTTGDARGRFGASRAVGRWQAVPPAVAAGPGGAALVTWEAADGIRIALRTKAGRAFRVRRLTTSTGSAINGLTARHDPRGGWFVAERQFPRRGSGKPYRVRTFTLRPDGTLRLPPVELGLGQFGIDARPTRALAVDRLGRATLAFGTQGGPRGVLVARGTHGGQLANPRPLPSDGSVVDARVAAAAAGTSLVTATKATRCGDGGACSGAPFVWRSGETGDPVALGGPQLDVPGRAFGPSVAPLAAGGASLVFQLKDGSQPFARQAPVKAVRITANGTVGRLQTLTSRPAQEPVAVPLTGSRALVVWSGTRGFGAALADSRGAYRTVAPPVGPPPSSGHSNPTNRDVASAGRYVLVAWDRGGRVRLTLRRF